MDEVPAGENITVTYNFSLSTEINYEYGEKSY